MAGRDGDEVMESLRRRRVSVLSAWGGGVGGTRKRGRGGGNG